MAENLKKTVERYVSSLPLGEQEEAVRGSKEPSGVGKGKTVL